MTDDPFFLEAKQPYMEKYNRTFSRSVPINCLTTSEQYTLHYPLYTFDNMGKIVKYTQHIEI